MEIYSPYLKTREESEEDIRDFHERVVQMNVSNETLTEYVQTFFEYYRKTLDNYFPQFAPAIPFYAHYPFETIVLRIDNNGVIIGHRPSENGDVKIILPSDLDPPVDSLSIFDIVQRLQVPFSSFDFSPRNYSKEEANLEGTRQALSSALDFFWAAINEQAFAKICEELLVAEGVKIEANNELNRNDHYDAVGQVLLKEPADFRRFETWTFEFKHYRDERVSVNALRQVETYLNNSDEVDAICLLTSGDLTSIGRYIAIKNSRIRVWDRYILNHIIHQHLDVLGHYFSEYPAAVEALSKQFVAIKSPWEEFEVKIRNCPPGQKHFAEYEKIGIEIWRHLFGDALGKPKSQVTTRDGKQRRDVLFKNKRTSGFFKRVAERFDADFVIVDFKNYSAPVNAEVIDDVAKYANKALGRFIVAVSRFEADDTVEASQHRWFRDSDTVVLVLNDKQMLEMVDRKERGETPEDVLEDLLDEFLIRY